MNEHDPSEEILEKLFSEARSRSIPDGPSDELIARTLAALSQAPQGRGSFFHGVRNMRFITRIAASVLLIVGIAILAAVMLRSPSITCAEIVQKVRRPPHSLSFVMNVQVKAAKPIQMKVMMNDQGQFNSQGSDGMRMVSDARTGRMVIVQPQNKTAVVMNMKNMPKSQTQPDDFIERFKKLSGDSAKDLGPTEIDGRKAEKFTATQEHADFTIWADPETREPIRLDIAMNVMDQNVTASCTEFVLNPTFPDDAFTLEAPAGYDVQQFTVNMPDINDGEQNVIETLRGFATRDNGKFPANINNMNQYLKVLQAHATTRPTDADIQWIMRFQFSQHFLGTLPKDGWKYMGDGKTTADTGALIFWYKSAKGYRGIYGDLSAKDLQSAPQ